MKKVLGATLIILSIILMFLSLTLGPSHINLQTTLSVLKGQQIEGNQGYIIWQLRLPRILSSFLTGAILGVSGTVFQAALRNPMADPFILGISSGASFGVALALFIGIAPLLGFPLSALIGAILTTLFIVGIATKRSNSNTSLLLTGVAVNYILSAAMTLLMVLHREQYQRILYWTLGSFSSSTYTQVITLCFTFALLFFILRANHEKMDLLLLDEASAHASGLAVGKTRLLLLLVGSAASAVCVSYYGVIGFIGLMAPHVTRLVVGPKHSRLLLPSALFGGLLLLASDTVSRILLPSGELPVGIITSLLGVPLFIYLLRKGRYRLQHQVFENLNLTLPSGKFIALTGPNGSGKSTLLRFIYKQLKPNEGAVFVDGTDIEKLTQRQLATKLGFVAQNGQLEYSFTVREAVSMGRFAYKGIDTDHIVDKAIQSCDIEHLQNSSVTELSGGEMQRVLLARALCQDGKLLLLDEPVNHLDVQHQRSMMAMLSNLVHEGYTVICVLHDLLLVQVYSQLALVLQKGKIVSYGNTEEVFTDSLLEEVYHIKAHQVYDKELNRELWLPSW